MKVYKLNLEFSSQKNLYFNFNGSFYDVSIDFRVEFIKKFGEFKNTQFSFD